MVRAFVTVPVGPGAAVGRVVESIRGLAAVETVHVLAGDVDAMAEPEVDETYEVMAVVTDGIPTLEAVTDTITYVSIG